MQLLQPKMQILTSEMISERRQELQKLIGNTVSDARLQKVVPLVQKLCLLQPRDHATALLAEKQVNKDYADVEFGADLVFREPARFLVDLSLENSDLLGEDTITPTFYDRQHVHDDSINFDLSNERGKLNLSWLRDACDDIIRKSTSQLSLDELAMAICRVLDSEKPGEEVATHTPLEYVYHQTCSFLYR